MTFYGRKNVTVVTNLGEFTVLSGQWVGHRYGQEDGSDRQIENLKKNFIKNLENALPEKVFNRLTYDFLVDVQPKIFWKKGGCTGDILEVPKHLKQYFF